MDPGRTGTSAEIPLLSHQNHRRREDRWVIWRAVFNVSTTIIGAGIMSIPATLKVLGVIPAFVMIVLVALLVDITVNFMLRATYAGQATTYAGLMKEHFGKIGSLAVQICVMISTLGCLIMYLIIIGDVFSGKGEHLGILQEWLGVHWWNSRYLSILLTVLLVVLPLVLYRHVVIAIAKGQIVRPRMLPELNSGSSFFNLFTAIPVIVTAFAFHFNVHPIEIELGIPGAMTSAVTMSLVICSVIYFSIGIFGYLLFGDSINADILVNFDTTSSGAIAISPVLNDIVRLSYAFHLMLVFPLLNFSLRANLDELIFPKKELLATDTKRFMFLTLFLLAFSYVVAISIPSVWYIYQFMGSTSNACLAFIFPGAIALRDVHGLSSRKDKIIAVVMIVLAVVTSIITIAANITGCTHHVQPN